MLQRPLSVKAACGPAMGLMLLIEERGILVRLKYGFELELFD